MALLIISFLTFFFSFLIAESVTETAEKDGWEKFSPPKEKKNKKKKKERGRQQHKKIRVSDAVLLYVRVFYIYIYIYVTVNIHTRCVRDPHYYDDD